MEKKTTGRKGILFFLRNTFKYYANAVLMSSTDIATGSVTLILN